MLKIRNFIDGSFESPLSGHFLSVENPSNGQIYGECPNSDASDAGKAIRAAKKSQPAWNALAPSRRSEILLKIADILERRLIEFARAESQDQGKPVDLAATLDIPRSISNFRFFATRLLHLENKAFPTSTDVFHYVERAPVGVVGLITPWNLPLYLLTWKIAPAIAFGNTVVCKPSELTPLTAFLLCDVFQEAGLPPGVVNMLFGAGPRAGQAIIEHPDIKAISFTGGTQTGRQIARTAAPLFKKLSLELGGKNPNIIFADASFDSAVQTSLRSSFLNQGEICLCGSRIYVQKPIYNNFLNAFHQLTRSYRVGDPADTQTQMGALVSRSHLEKVEGYVAQAIADGGKILCGGKRPVLPAQLSSGYFFEPTILIDVPHNSRVIQEEIFGPVVTVTPFESEEDVINLANEPAYGLAASVWTENLSRAHRVARALDAGIVWVNGWMLRDLRVPFGGIKESGIGREGGDWSYDFYTETKDICVRIQPQVPKK